MRVWPPDTMKIPDEGEDMQVVLVGRDANGVRFSAHTTAAKILTHMLNRPITGAVVQTVETIQAAKRIQT